MCVCAGGCSLPGRWRRRFTREWMSHEPHAHYSPHTASFACQCLGVHGRGDGSNSGDTAQHIAQTTRAALRRDSTQLPAARSAPAHRRDTVSRGGPAPAPVRRDHVHEPPVKERQEAAQRDERERPVRREAAVRSPRGQHDRPLNNCAREEPAQCCGGGGAPHVRYGHSTAAAKHGGGRGQRCARWRRDAPRSNRIRNRFATREETGGCSTPDTSIATPQTRFTSGAKSGRKGRNTAATSITVCVVVATRAREVLIEGSRSRNQSVARTFAIVTRVRYVALRVESACCTRSTDAAPPPTHTHM